MPILPAPPTASTSTAAPSNAATPVIYRVGNYIASHDLNITSWSSVSGPNGYVIMFAPFDVRRTITIDTLAVSIGTAFAGGSGNGRVGVYRSRTTGEPYPSTVAVNGGAQPWTSVAVVPHTFTAVQLTAGLYWFAIQSDNSTSGGVRAGLTAGYNRAIVGWPSYIAAQTNIAYFAPSFGFPDLSAVSIGSFQLGGQHAHATWARISSVP
jgi:hypothetical protein